MQYIAAIDYEHLDNGVFLTALAKSLSQQQNVQPIIIHGDSKYTERVIQTGVMREDARIRSMKDLNHRLVALFADQGVSSIGINGHQRKLIKLEGESLQIDKEYLQSLPEGPVLLLSALAHNTTTGEPVPIALSRFAQFLRSSLEIDPLFVFSRSKADEVLVKNDFAPEASWDDLDPSFVEDKIPPEFQDFNKNLFLTTAQKFHDVSSPESAMKIK